MTKSALTLTGDDPNEPMDLTESQVNHLRRVLAWLTCEYNLSVEGQRGFQKGLLGVVTHDPSKLTAAQAVLDREAERIQHVPVYIRRGIKALTKAIREHDERTRVLSASFKWNDE